MKVCRFGGCKICNAKHNTVLHDNAEGETKNVHLATNSQIASDELIDPSASETSSEQSICAFSVSSNAILSTVSVIVCDKNNGQHAIRALLDCGSQSSFISTELANKLQLPKLKTNLCVSGLNNSISYVQYKCNITVFSRCNQFSIDISCFIIDRITGTLPEFAIDTTSWNIPQNIKLADPRFDKPGKIDMLIGADIFWQLLCIGQISLGTSKPILQKTRFGWVVAGQFHSTDKSTVTSCHVSQNLAIQNQLSKFWEIEEINSNAKPRSLEGQLCELHYTEHLKIHPDGKYLVSIPLNGDVNSLGDSRYIAEKRFLSLEKRLKSNPNMYSLYVDFMHEYEKLGHMTRLNEDDDDKPEYFMPHHGVLKESNLTTKLRVVFNASSPSSTGISFNSLQMTGPILQPDLVSILINFRFFEVVLSSDIKMMYRMIFIDPDQRKFQKIIWRDDPDKDLSVFQLNTVTYGTTAGSFLAIRSLYQLANEIKSEHPCIANIIRKNMYVDDLLTGATDVEQAKQLCRQIHDIFITRGFQLRKWRSNRLEAIQDFSHDSEPIEFSLNKEQEAKTLGLTWNSEIDFLSYKVTSSKCFAEKVTKRTILSKVASIFDPMGLLAPCIILAKILLQKLWVEGLSWDESLPSSLHAYWLEFSSNLDSLNALKIPRKVTCNQATYIEIHGFADASIQAYGGCVYIKSVSSSACSVELLCAKSKVAPLKTLTTPRLQLCAALTLARLISKVLESTDVKFDRIVCWSDSTIVLGWLKTPPNLLKPFVDNRVAEIQKITQSFEWRHVPTHDNPADLLSRGVKPENVSKMQLWWQGPTWLQDDEANWPNVHYSNPTELPELRKTFKVTLDATFFPFDRFSNINRLKHSFAYVIRFKNNCLRARSERIKSELTNSEINHAFQTLIRFTQMLCFPNEYRQLKNKKPLDSTSKILALNPFLDEQGPLRVGGRLTNSELPFSRKHPLLLDSSHHLTKLIFVKAHKDLLHAGPQAMISHVRETFWPISARNLAKFVVRQCVPCSRYAGKTIQPIMGDLPASRVTAALPFIRTGVDYGGPILIKDRRGRGCKTQKCWIALFIFFSTKAIHLELVTALTTASFMQALRRFAARRGKPSDIYSDQGTNFVGAKRELGQFLKEKSSEIVTESSTLSISWHFIPASSPHFGGLWESGIKSVKHHLRRVMGNHCFTFEELYTLLVQIESVLNSRPMYPLSSDPSDLSCLTPAHFLIGRPLLTIPEPDYLHLPENRLSLYQHLQQIQQHFWTRWSKDYLNELQQRNRWNKSDGRLSIGQLVLIKEDHLPPKKWRLGRVLQLTPGNDNISRVATILTADGELTRAVRKICALPIESGDFQPRGHVKNQCDGGI
nr:unnamed protein product [Callosobruchus analis]